MRLTERLPRLSSLAARALALSTRPWLRSVAILGFGLALGACVVAYEQRGVAHNAVLGICAAASGVIIGLLPIRYAVAGATVLSALHGVLVDFVGGHASYWKEGLLLVLLLRSVHARRPSRREVGVALLVFVFFAAYSLRGISAYQIAWGAKTLLEFVVFCWAIWRLAEGAREWVTLNYALGVVVAAGAVIAIWQRTEGSQGLVNLGLPYGQAVRESGGQLRAFAGFGYEAPFAYVAALAVLLWCALAISRDRRALELLWTPLFGGIDILLSLNRTAVLAVLVALSLVVIRLAGRRMMVTALLSGAVIIAGGTLASPQSFRTAARDVSLQQRIHEWPYYLRRLTVAGKGPATAGGAYEHVLHHRYSVYVVPNRPGLTVERRVAEANRFFHVTDNIYVAWLYQYGLAAGPLIVVAWLVVLLWPFIHVRRNDGVAVAASLSGIFFILAGFFNNVWEEFPPNMLLAVIVAVWLRTGCRRSLARDCHPDASPR